MFTQDKLKKLHRILTSKISRASKKLSLNMKIKKASESTHNKKNVIIKSKSVKNKRKKINQDKNNNSRKNNHSKEKSFQHNISHLSEIKKKEENFNDSFASYLTDNNFIHKNKIRNVTIIKNNTKEFYDKSLLFHIMKYYITKSNNNSIKFESLYYILKPMKNLFHNSRKNNSNNSSNEKTKYIYYDDKFNLTFGKNNNNNIEINETKNNRIKSNKINSLNLMNNQIFNNNFIFNINNYRGNAKSAKNKIIKNIINEENTPSFHKENSKENIKKHIIKDIEKKKINLPKNYINIEELKKNNHIIMNLLHKKKAIENANNISGNKQKNNFVYPKANSARKKISLIEEINNRIKYRN